MFTVKNAHLSNYLNNLLHLLFSIFLPTPFTEQDYVELFFGNMTNT